MQECSKVVNTAVLCTKFFKEKCFRNPKCINILRKSQMTPWPVFNATNSTDALINACSHNTILKVVGLLYCSHYTSSRLLITLTTSQRVV